jgi:methylglutaconyl-CoA hydratase
MRTCGKIVVVRVQGKTTGGGVGIACAADYCFATKEASLALPELNLGIGPFVIICRKKNREISVHCNELGY